MSSKRISWIAICACFIFSISIFYVYTATGYPILIVLGIVCLAITARLYATRSNIYFHLAYSYYQNGDLQEASTSLDLAVINNPRYADAYYLRGIIAYENQNSAKAIADLSRAIQYNLSSEKAFYAFFYRGLCYWSQKDGHANILADLNRTIALNHKYEPAYFWRGQLHLVEHRFPEAIEDFSQSIKMQPDHAYAYMYRGHAFICQGKQETALADFSDFICLNPDLSAGYYNRAVIRYNLGEFQAALADFDKVIEIDPTYPSSYYGRSNIYVQLNHLEVAIIDFERARELEPDYAIEKDDQHGFYHAGLAHHHQGYSQFALEHLNHALRLCHKHHDNLMAEIVTNTIQSISTKDTEECE